MVLIFSGLSAGALDIPLSGTGSSGGNGGHKIAYVDLERIFQIFPETKFAKEDYAKRLVKMREDLANREEEISTFNTRIEVLESTLKQLEGKVATKVETSTNTPVDSTEFQFDEGEDSEALVKMKKDLEEKISGLEDARKRATRELSTFENQQSQVILGKIYLALKDLANDEQVTLVVDKSSILFGSTDIDLTEKLQQRVRGY